MIRSALIPVFAVLLTSCGSLQPVKDTAERSTLILPGSESASTLYPAPVFTVTIPTYLNESTVWYSDADGVLTALPDFIWADPLSKSLRRELSLGLAHNQPYTNSSRIEINFAQFILLDDGSATTVAAVRFSSPQSEEVLPVVNIRVENVWTPAEPASYLKGYQALLRSTIKEIAKILPPPSTIADSIKKPIE